MTTVYIITYNSRDGISISSVHLSKEKANEEMERNKVVDHGCCYHELDEYEVVE